jgi:hypothetical protein
MRVALLLYGQPRAIDNDIVWRSHKKHILDKYDTDVFCHMWYADPVANTTFEVSGHAGQAPPIVPNSDRIIQARYSPVAMKVDTPRKFDETPYKRAFEEGGKYKCNPNFPNYISQLYSVEQVARLFSTYQHAKKYDFILVTRYDIVVEQMPSLHSLDHRCFYTLDPKKVFEIIFVFSPTFLESQFVFTDLEKRIRNNYNKGTIWEPNPECMRYIKYVDHFSPKLLRSFPIQFSWNPPRA